MSNKLDIYDGNVWDLAAAELSNKELISLLGERELTLDDIVDLNYLTATSLEYDHLNDQDT